MLQQRDEPRLFVDHRFWHFSMHFTPLVRFHNVYDEQNEDQGFVVV
jgi:hypothetical protein